MKYLTYFLSILILFFISCKSQDITRNDFKSDTEFIRSLIKNAGNGQTINLKKGIYNLYDWKPIVINKSLKIEGDSTVLIGNGQNFLNFKKDFIVQGLIFDGFKYTISSSANNSFNAIINDNVFVNCERGINFNKSKGSYSFKSEITNNQFIGNSKGHRAIGIFSENSDFTIIQNNSIKGFQFYGICVGNNQSYFHQNLTIKDNTIEDIVNSRHKAEAHGIIVYGNNISISNNTIINIINGGGGQGAEGIYTKGNNIIINKNNITNGGGTGQGFINIKGAKKNEARYPKSYNITIDSNIIKETRKDFKSVLINISSGFTKVSNNQLINGAVGLKLDHARSDDSISLINNKFFNQSDSGMTLGYESEDLNINLNYFEGSNKGIHFYHMRASKNIHVQNNDFNKIKNSAIDFSNGATIYNLSIKENKFSDLPLSVSLDNKYSNFNNVSIENNVSSNVSKFLMDDPSNYKRFIIKNNTISKIKKE